MWAAHPDSEARLSRNVQAGRSLLRLGTAIVLFGFLVLLIALVSQGVAEADEPASRVGDPGVGAQPVPVPGGTAADRLDRTPQRDWQADLATVRADLAALQARLPDSADPASSDPSGNPSASDAGRGRLPADSRNIVPKGAQVVVPERARWPQPGLEGEGGDGDGALPSEPAQSVEVAQLQVAQRTGKDPMAMSPGELRSALQAATDRLKQEATGPDAAERASARTRLHSLPKEPQWEPGRVPIPEPAEFVSKLHGKAAQLRSQGISLQQEWTQTSNAAERQASDPTIMQSAIDKLPGIVQQARRYYQQVYDLQIMDWLERQHPSEPYPEFPMLLPDDSDKVRQGELLEEQPEDGVAATERADAKVAAQAQVVAAQAQVVVEQPVETPTVTGQPVVTEEHQLAAQAPATERTSDQVADAGVGVVDDEGDGWNGDPLLGDNSDSLKEVSYSAALPGFGGESVGVM